MAKDLPYFKFMVAEWLTGDIIYEDLETQGLFINVCAHYWNKSGDITITEIKRRLLNLKPNAFDSLFKSEIISVKNDKITIKFLDEQLSERKGVSQINSKNGKKGGRPKKIICDTKPTTGNEKKPNGLLSESERLLKQKAKKSNKEAEEEIEKNKIKNKKFIPPTIQEVKDFFKEKGYKEDIAIRAFNHYDLGNWIDAKGNPVLSWKQKMNTNWFKDEYKISQPIKQYTVPNIR